MVVVTVLGAAFTESNLLRNAVLTRGSNGSITLVTDRSFGEESTLTYELPPGSIPATARIRSIEVRVCGSGTGDFWESYGPEGSDPEEYEGAPPEADGCWHFAGAPGPSTKVVLKQTLATTVVVTKIEYTVTF